MKRLFLLSVLFAGLAFLFIQCSGKPFYIKVVDEDGIPVGNVELDFGWTTGQPWGPSFKLGTPHAMGARTKDNGLAYVRMPRFHRVTLNSYHKDFYAGRLNFSTSDQANHASQSTALVFPLKKIRNPSAFIAKKAYIILPDRQGSAGYDLVEGDLVSPLGKGRYADILIDWKYAEEHGGYHQRPLWDFRFPEKTSGIQAQRPDPIDLSSELKSKHTAPLQGYSRSLRAAEDQAEFGERGPWGPVTYYFVTKRPDKTFYGKILEEPDIIFYNEGKTVVRLTYALNLEGTTSMESDEGKLRFPKRNDWEESYKLP